MNKHILSLLTLAILGTTSTAYADYIFKIPLEKSAISFVTKGSGGENGNGSGGTGGTETGGSDSGSTEEPEVPVTPEEPKPEEPKDRSLVFSGNFNTFTGETNLWTDGKKDAFSTSTYDIVIKGALKQDSIYYVTNNNKECAYIADICETVSGQNRCGPYTSVHLSGTNTILSLLGPQDKSCVTVNAIWGQKVVNNLKVYDGPVPE